MMLVGPGGAKVRCVAHKRFALAVATQPRDGEPALTVILRTDNPDTARETGKREARKRSRPVLLFTLRDGRFVGSYYPDGSAVVAARAS